VTEQQVTKGLVVRGLTHRIPPVRALIDLTIRLLPVSLGRQVNTAALWAGWQARGAFGSPILHPVILGRGLRRL
jgi:hypothetical protein